jgi:hypothetical protein
MSEIHFSRGSGIHDNRPQQRVAEDFADFIAALDADRAAQKAGAAYVAGPLNGDGRRCAGGALPRRWLALDFDRIDADTLPDLRLWLARFRGCGWPTHSSRPDAPRERVILELDRDADRAECIRIGEALAADLREAFGGAIELDPSTFRGEQPIFVPPVGVTLARFEGEPLRVADYIARETPQGASDGPQGHERGEDGPTIKAGGRNAALARIAGSLRRAGLSPSEIEAALLQVNRERCAPPLPDAEVRGIARSVGKYAPGDGSAETPAPLDILRDFAAPPLDVAGFPPVIRDFATLTAQAAGHDPSPYLMAMLCSVGAMLDQRICVALDQRTAWLQPARLWVLLIGGAGAAKTPAINCATATIDDVHGELRAAWQQQCADVPKGEPQRPPPALFVSDATIEALADALEANPRGVLFRAHELDSWLGAHDAYRNGVGSKDRGHWLQLFDGTAHEIHRKGREVQFIQHYGAALLTATTPDGLRRHSKALPADGLLQRFLPVMVRPMVRPDRGVSGESIAEAAGAYAARLRALHGYFPTAPVRLSADAAAQFGQRLDELRESVQAVGEVSPPFASHLAKHAGLIGRVALALHAATLRGHPAEEAISGATMGAAVGLMRRLTSHAAALYSSLGVEDSAQTLARACARSILADAAPSVTRHWLMQKCRPFRDAAESVREPALRLLLDAGWLIALADAPKYGGRVAAWAIDPRVHELFSEQGEQHRQRRARVRAALQGEA